MLSVFARLIFAAVFAAAKEKFGGIDVAVNTVGRVFEKSLR